MKEELKFIIAKSGLAAPYAIKALQALAAGSPMIHVRYTHAVKNALEDPEANLSEEDREFLVRQLAISSDQPGFRSKIVQVRVTPLERVDLGIMAKQAGHSTIAEWTRSLWGIG